MNAKGDLIARLVSLGLGTPTFEAEARGPAHQRTFYVKVWSGGGVISTAEGRTKKDAERLAAEIALRGLGGEGVPPAAPAPVVLAPVAPATTGTPMTPGTAVTTPAPAALPQGEIWPVYAQVLAEAVEAAMEFSPEGATLSDVRRDAGRFYRELLSDLGHGPEA